MTSRLEQTRVDDDPGVGVVDIEVEVDLGVEVGVIVVEVTVTVAGMVVDNNTFSLVWSVEAIDKTCVLAESNVKFGSVGAVAAVALSWRIAIVVFPFTALVGSAPIDKEIEAFPDSYAASSMIVVKVFDDSGFALRLSDMVVNFVGSKLIANFTKET